MIIAKDKKRGRMSRILSEILIDKDSTMSLKYSKIETKDKVYVFNYPVLFQIYQEGNDTIIENELLDIFAGGRTIEDAKNELFYQFDHTYNRFNELKDNQLSPSLLESKRYFNFIIKSIQDKECQH